jgi:FPC/CPF motif-containing protein YcgG
MTVLTSCRHVFVYSGSIGGYLIICRKCGEVRGSSERAHPKFLVGFNPNQQKADTAGNRVRKRRKSG